MNFVIPISILSILVIAGLSFFLIKSRIKVSILNKKFGRAIDVEIERDKIVKEIKLLEVERDKFKTEFMSKKNKLNSEYDNAHKAYDTMKKEISILEESLEMTEFGIYKPHFEFNSPDEYRRRIETLTNQEKECVRSDGAIRCTTEWSVSGSKANGRKMTKQNHKLMLRAFNGECDAALAKVRWDNATKMEKRICKAFETVNKSGEVNGSYITKQYLELKIKKLQLTFEYQEKM